ncbi:MAG: DUF4921 family protein [Pirellulaceae bacterium]|nr:DUF4921 family protein [Pirellulaceae bacterium]
MPQFRKDPFSDRWVLLAENRAERPNAIGLSQATGLSSQESVMARCPFCAGNEADTPPATAVYREGEILCGHGEWQVRVVPNKFPAVTFSGRPELQPDSIFFQTRDGEGIHEVIVESRDHRTSFSELSSAEARWVFQAYRDRCEEIKDTTELRYVQIFKNARPGAGASMEHAHSQLIATSDVPPFVEAELAHARQSARPSTGCSFCEMIRVEFAAKARIVMADSDVVAICPFASRFPYETWVLPRFHTARFEEMPNSVLASASEMTRCVIKKMEIELGKPAYNYLLHTAPLDSGLYPYYHWHLEIFPRLTQWAGYEIASGNFINPVAPEKAAERLRASAN